MWAFHDCKKFIYQALIHRLRRRKGDVEIIKKLIDYFNQHIFLITSCLNEAPSIAVEAFIEVCAVMIVMSQINILMNNKTGKYGVQSLLKNSCQHMRIVSGPTQKQIIFCSMRRAPTTSPAKRGRWTTIFSKRYWIRK